MKVIAPLRRQAYSSLRLFKLVLMSVLEEVDDAASRPGLGRALGSNVSMHTLARAKTQCTHRISTEGAIFVRKLGQARPRALPDSFHAAC